MKQLCLRILSAAAAALFFLETADSFPLHRSPSRLTADAAAFQVQGIDVSKFQEDIDWDTVSKGGEQFAIIRCCKVTHSTGQKEYDYNFELNYAGAKNAGLAVGCYMFTDAATEEEFSDDIAFLTEHLEGKSFDLPVFLDLESKTRQEHLPPDVFMPPLLSALAQIEGAGHTAGVYANTAFFSECLDREMLLENQYHIWEANYFNTLNGLSSPQGHDLSDGAAIWQYSGCGRIKGVRTEVDRNVCYTESYFKRRTEIEDAVLPYGILEQASQFAVSGTVTSDAVIRSLTGTICHTGSGEPTDQTVTVNPLAKHYDLSGDFSRKLVFSALPEGEYTLRITATDSSGKTCTLADAPFRVYQSAMYEPEKRAAQIAVDHAISEAGSTGTTTTTTTTTTTETTTLSEEPETTAQSTAFRAPAKSPDFLRYESVTRTELRFFTSFLDAIRIRSVLDKAASLAGFFGLDGLCSDFSSASDAAGTFLDTAQIVLDAK